MLAVINQTFLNNGYYFLFETKLTKKNHKYNTITYL